MDKLITKIQEKKEISAILCLFSYIFLAVMLFAIYKNWPPLSAFSFGIIGMCDSLLWLSTKNKDNFYMRGSFANAIILLVFGIIMGVSLKFFDFLPKSYFMKGFIFLMILYVLLTGKAFSTESKGKNSF